MFERFTGDARNAVTAAEEESRRLRHGFIGPEHLLLGLAARGAGPAAEALAASGLTLQSLRERVAAGADDPLDAEALACLGIDLDAVRRATEVMFGPGALDRRGSCRRWPRAGHIPFAPDAKKSLELALREAARLEHREISPGHVLLGILRAGDNVAVRTLAAAGLDVRQLRDDVIRRLATAA